MICSRHPEDLIGRTHSVRGLGMKNSTQRRLSVDVVMSRSALLCDITLLFAIANLPLQTTFACLEARKYGVTLIRSS